MWIDVKWEQERRKLVDLQSEKMWNMWSSFPTRFHHQSPQASFETRSWNQQLDFVRCYKNEKSNSKPSVSSLRFRTWPRVSHSPRVLPNRLAFLWVPTPCLWISHSVWSSADQNIAQSPWAVEYKRINRLQYIHYLPLTVNSRRCILALSDTTSP